VPRQKVEDGVEGVGHYSNPGAAELKTETKDPEEFPGNESERGKVNFPESGQPHQPGGRAQQRMAASGPFPLLVEGSWGSDPPKNLSTKLQMYFQSPKRSGGGECEVRAEPGSPGRFLVLFFPEDGEGREGSAEDQAGSFCGDTGGPMGEGGRRVEEEVSSSSEGRWQGLESRAQPEYCYSPARLGAAWRNCASQSVSLSCLSLLRLFHLGKKGAKKHGTSRAFFVVHDSGVPWEGERHCYHIWM
jgi:hypothetical protein